MLINIWKPGSPDPRFRPSTPEGPGRGLGYRACSSQGGPRGSWTWTDGRTHSCHSQHAPHCRRPGAGGSPGRSSPNTGAWTESYPWFITVSEEAWHSYDDKDNLKTFSKNSPQSSLRWPRRIHRGGCCRAPSLGPGSGWHSTCRGPRPPAGPHTAGSAVGGPTHTIYCTTGAGRNPS